MNFMVSMFLFGFKVSENGLRIWMKNQKIETKPNQNKTNTQNKNQN